MALRPSPSKSKPFTLSLIFLSLSLLLLTINFRPRPNHHLQTESPVGPVVHSATKTPKWYDVVRKEINVRKIKFGLVNIHERVDDIEAVKEISDTVTITFDRVADDQKWEDLYPEWIDEDEKWGPMTCPKIPMPNFEDYREVDAVIAMVPCGRGNKEREGVRDVFRLQVNLIVANLLVRSGWKDDEVNRTVLVVFIGSCGPMLEIFKCDDLLWHEDEGEYWVYRPDLRKLKQKVLMPVGSCQIAPPFAEPGQEVWRMAAGSTPNTTLYHPREAYVTVLHSSETYVCGAIALAQSIIQTNSTKDLLLLADDSISPNSIRGLKAAGWKIKPIKRIRSPHAEKDAYNEWNYSKLRIWQLTEYDKVIFIDADLIVLKNMDDFFLYPQLSAAANDLSLFNSGVMLVEPSQCFFKSLMEKRFTIPSYNGGDQGFLNEVFTWWHKWHSNSNYLKIFDNETDPRREIPNDVYSIHYLGLKPWMCYEDYDCNWDMLNHHPFANDMAHRMWWKVYKRMPKKLRSYCELTKSMEARIRKWRGRAKSAGFPDGHWKIKVKDRRQHSV